jgi:hypothetical protein
MFTNQKPISIKTTLNEAEIATAWNRNIYVNYRNTPTK